MNDVAIISTIERIYNALRIGYGGYREIYNSTEITASVLVPLACHQNEFVILFTRRSERLLRHKGQVSFPGGIRELKDGNLLDTALRETKEEIGIPSEQIRILGSLPPVASTKGFFILPIVGFINNLNGLQPNHDEVAKIFCVPYNWIINMDNVKLIDYVDQKGIMHKVWSYSEFEGEVIWGITANILQSFITMSQRKN